MSRLLLLSEVAILSEAYRRLNVSFPPLEKVKVVREEYPPLETRLQFNTWFTLHFVEKLPRDRLAVAVPLRPDVLGAEIFVLIDKVNYMPLLLDFPVPEGMPPGWFQDLITRIDGICVQECKRHFLEFPYCRIVDLGTSISFLAATTLRLSSEAGRNRKQLVYKEAIIQKIEKGENLMLEGIARRWGTASKEKHKLYQYWEFLSSS